MKQKKRSGLSRIGALLLVIILAINLVVSHFCQENFAKPLDKYTWQCYNTATK